MIVGMVVGVVVLGVTALIGILVFGELYSAMPLDDAVYSSGGALEGVPAEIVGGVGNAFELVPIVMLVMLASVVIAVVARTGGGFSG